MMKHESEAVISSAKILQSQLLYFFLNPYAAGLPCQADSESEIADYYVLKPHIDVDREASIPPPGVSTRFVASAPHDCNHTSEARKFSCPGFQVATNSTDLRALRYKSLHVADDSPTHLTSQCWTVRIHFALALCSELIHITTCAAPHALPQNDTDLRYSSESSIIPDLNVRQLEAFVAQVSLRCYLKNFVGLPFYVHKLFHH